MHFHFSFAAYLQELLKTEQKKEETDQTPKKIENILLKALPEIIADNGRIQKDIKGILLDQNQIIDGLSVQEKKLSAEYQRHDAELKEKDRECQQLKKHNDTLKSMYEEAKNYQDKLMNSENFRQPVRSNDEIELLEGLKTQLAEVSTNRDQLLDENSALRRLLCQANLEASEAKSALSKAALEVCWIILDSIRTNKGVVSNSLPNIHVFVKHYAPVVTKSKYNGI